MINSTTELLERVLQSPRLPSLPTIALKVLDLAQQPDVDFRHIADAIQHDPGLSTKILKTVNSAFYGQAREIATVSRALQVLGLNSVKTLALGFSLVGNLEKSQGKSFDHVTYWRRSLYTATAARILSRRAGIVQQEEAFIGGLLQDMGMVALSQALGDEYDTVLQQAAGDHAALRDHELQRLGVNHAEVGAALAEAWKLPPVLVAPIRYHEAPDGVDPEFLTLVRSVSLGNRVADIFLSADGEGAALETYYTQAKMWFDIPRDEAEPALKDIHAETESLGNLFELPTGNLGNPDEILARANEALMQLTLQSQQENTQLINEVRTDALTGVANRRALDQSVREQFERATPDSPTSVLFSDLDHFKRFNDTHGHALGDQVLVVFAETLRRTVGDQGTVFRYGGEEFTIVCPNTDRTTAARIAEQLCRAVEQSAEISAEDGRALTVTCSIGVATHAGDSFESVERLVHAADAAVYAAKAAGRNGVRTHWSLGESDAA